MALVRWWAFYCLCLHVMCCLSVSRVAAAEPGAASAVEVLLPNLAVEQPMIINQSSTKDQARRAGPASLQEGFSFGIGNCSFQLEDSPGQWQYHFCQLRSGKGCLKYQLEAALRVTSDDLGWSRLLYLVVRGFSVNSTGMRITRLVRVAAEILNSHVKFDRMMEKSWPVSSFLT